MPRMMDDGLDALRERGEAFLVELSREYYEAHAGLKGEAQLQPIFAKHAGAFDDEALAQVQERFRDAPPASEAHRSARMLLDWLVESRCGRELAELEEREIAWEGSAVIRGNDGAEEPYQRAAITIANTRDKKERQALDDARAQLVAAELAPLKRERLAREHEVVASLGVAGGDGSAARGGYIATWEALSGFSIAPLRDACAQFLRDTQAMWDDVLPEFLKRGLNLTPREATRADAIALMRAPEFDGAFPATAMEYEVRRAIGQMGASPDAHGRVVFDTGDRPGKRARAFCSPVRIPDEVYLVLRPQGGQGDWTTLMHELGHALHFANMDRSLPFEFRWLGDNSVTEGYAMLFDHRLKDRGWLSRHSELSKADTPKYLRAAGFEELQFLRRYCAKLIYEVELHAGTTPWDALPDLYVETLTTATGFRYQRADAFLDVDPRFYAARYLRAWQLQALLNESLCERFNEDWWRNPHAGPWIEAELFGHGQRELATEQAARVAGRELSFAPLIRAVEGMLQ
ncbi:MAG: gluzincin family metallopeptidase [Gemmatimonadaceae bacterium]